MKLTKRTEYLQKEEANKRAAAEILKRPIVAAKPKKATRYTAQVEPTVVEALSVTPNRIVSFRKRLEGFSQSRAHKANEYNLQNTAHNGQVSDKASARIEQCVQWLVAMAQPKSIWVKSMNKRVNFRINFITLTLSGKQRHDDSFIVKELFEKWLDWMRYNAKCTRYVWKAEAQGNGNIHFHIVTDTFMHYQDIRDAWNKIQWKYGYTDHYFQVKGHRNPPSTEVKSVKHVNRIANYLAKYMSKNRAFECVGELRQWKGEQFEMLYDSEAYKLEAANKKHGKVVGHVLGERIRAITCRLWYCSRDLSKCKAIVVDETAAQFEDLHNALMQTEFRTYYSDYCTMYYADFAEAWKKSETAWSRTWRNKLAEYSGSASRELSPVTEF